MWRAADPKRLQAQIKAAVPFKARGVKHTHAAFDEAMFRVMIENAITSREGVQRCECGAARVANINRAGEVAEYFPWTLSGYLVDYLFECDKLHGPKTAQELAEYDDCELDLLTGRWADPMTFSDVRALCETAHKLTKEEASRFSSSTEGDCHVDVPADWNRL